MAGLAALALVAGYLGPWHPVGDSFAVGRMAALAGLTVAAGLFGLGRRWRGAAVCLGLALAGGLTVWRPTAAPDAAGAMVLYQKNLLWRNPDHGPVVADILASGADLVTLQELRRVDHPVLRALAATHPHQAWCRFRGAGGTAVASRWPPLAEPVCVRGLSALRVAAPSGPLWVVSLHSHWPWPYNQGPHTADLVEVLSGLEGPVALAGDFNMAAWGRSVARLRAASRTRWQGGPVGTLPILPRLTPGLDWAIWPSLPIDHVFVPEGWGVRAELRPLFGSDHRGIAARIGPVADGAP